MERVTAHERQVASEARAMTRLEVIGKALSGSINWIEAAVVLGVTARHMRRLRLQYEIFGKEGLLDGRRGLPGAAGSLMRRSARCSAFAASSTRTSPSGIFTSISSRGMGSGCPTPSFG